MNNDFKLKGFQKNLCYKLKSIDTWTYKRFGKNDATTKKTLSDHEPDRIDSEDHELLIRLEVNDQNNVFKERYCW